jgi:benzoyl-CoA reductase subunit C
VDTASWADPSSATGEDRARREGLRRIAYFCSYVPEEILPVHGLFAYRMRAPDTPTTETADSYLGLFNCSHTRAMLESILVREADWMDGFELTPGCDHLRRLHDNLVHAVNPPFYRILGLPYKMHGDARDWYAEELALLREALAEHFRLSIGNEELRVAVKICNENRRLLASLNDLRRREPPPITGEDMQRLVIESFSLPKPAVNPALSEYLEQARDT